MRLDVHSNGGGAAVRRRPDHPSDVLRPVTRSVPVRFGIRRAPPGSAPIGADMLSPNHFLFCGCRGQLPA